MLVINTTTICMKIYILKFSKFSTNQKRKYHVLTIIANSNHCKFNPNPIVYRNSAN